MNPLLFVYEALCAGLFFTVFCRSVKTDSTVRTDVRFAFFVLAVVSCMGMVAPLAWSHEPDIFEVILLGAVVFVQVITAYHWMEEVPPQFVKTEFRLTRRRRVTDQTVGS